MKPAPFIYHAPKTVEEAVETLARVAPEDGRVLAGGQSLVPMMAFRVARPAHLVDINNVKGLDRLDVTDGKLVIGARVRHAAFHRPVPTGPLGVLLSDVVQHIAHHPIRTRGTFCGSLAHSDPASEWCAVAAALDAEMVARSTRGPRIIKAKEWFQGIMTTALAEDELLCEVRLPTLRTGVRVGFAEFNRRAGDFAIAMAVVLYRVQDGTISECRIAIGGAEATPRRIDQAEYALKGRAPTADSFSFAADVAAKFIEPVDDAQNSADYRRDVARAMVFRALKGAKDRPEPEVEPERAA